MRLNQLFVEMGLFIQHDVSISLLLHLKVMDQKIKGTKNYGIPWGTLGLEQAAKNNIKCVAP